MSGDAVHGVYGLDYYEGRKTKRALKYRLRRRTDEVERILRRYAESQLRTIVDVGTADGLMLEDLRRRLGPLAFVGLDMSRALLRARSLNSVAKVQGDAQSLPIRSEVADAVVATAVIEHVPAPQAMLAECRRVLKSAGLLVLTTPDPLMERVASRLGLLKASGHHGTFNLTELTRMVEEAGFQVLEAQKFMFSPIGFPAEKVIERVLGPLGLRLLMANQLVAARRV